MAVKKGGLGKGLDSLIPSKTSVEREAEPIENSSEVPENAYKDAVMVDIQKVEPNREQPRKTFNEDALLELSESIKQFGVLQPLLVQDKQIIMKSLQENGDGGQQKWQR